MASNRGYAFDGFNFFSIEILVKSNQIEEILRIGHCEDIEEILYEFPTKKLESEARRKLRTITSVSINKKKAKEYQIAQEEENKQRQIDLSKKAKDKHHQRGF